jgi:hypothetical protein
MSYLKAEEIITYSREYILKFLRQNEPQKHSTITVLQELKY